LSVTLDGVAIKPALALGGWTAFKPAHDGAMMMGDLVLLESEITPVMTAAIENGLEIAAIHNHVLRANPATFYMRVSGHGDRVKLANALRTALAASKTPLTSPPPPQHRTSPSTQRNSTISSELKENHLVAFISSVFRGATPSPRMECHSIRLLRLVWPPALTSSPPVMTKPQ
jgi:hypothetical protein